MFRNQIDTTVQFSKMIMQIMHDFVFKDHFFFTVFKFKTMVGQVYHGPFLCFSDEFHFCPRQVFFYQHTQCLGCAFILQRALQLLFYEAFCPGGSKIILTFSDTATHVLSDCPL